MIVTIALWWCVLVFLAAKTFGILVNLVLFPRLTASPAGAGNGRGRGLAGTSLLVPVRNEAAVLRRTLPGLLAQPVGEILLLDDESEDGTAAEARRLAAGDPRVRILRGARLPAGWVGKTWACSQLAEAARGERLVFLDADVHLEPGAIEALADEMDRQGADAFSVFPRQRTGSLSERALLPIIDDVLLSFLPFPLLRAPVPSAAAANGQVFAFRRAAYASSGGHAAVKGEILEDVLLARHVRRRGLRLGLALGGDLASVRMYRSDAELVRGLAKSLLPAYGGSRLLLILGALWHVVVYTLPVALLAWELRWAVPLALAVLQRVLLNAKTGRDAPWEALLVPVAPLLALPVHLRAMGRRRVWKGRSYA